MKTLFAVIGIVIFAGVDGCCNADEVTSTTQVVAGHTGQDDPVRRRSTVETLGRSIADHYAAKELSQLGVLDVTRAPYLADSTGRRDSTAAIQQAMKDARDARLITYLPAGSYRVSDTITCIQGVVIRDHPSFGGDNPSPLSSLTAGNGLEYLSDNFPCVLMGSRTGQRSRIVLASHSPGFGDTRTPKPVIHFWARSVSEWPAWWPREESNPPSPDLPEPAISFNQMIVDVDLSLGKGNPGAVGIDHQAAQGSAIEDVTVDARGAFAGLRRAPGSGGGVHGLTVIGGRYGMYLRGDPGVSGTQPVPVVSDVTLKGQTVDAVLYEGRGPLTIVGGWIEGAGVRAQAPTDPWNGAMNIVDTVFVTKKGLYPVTSNHSVYLHNVYFAPVSVIAHIEGRPELRGDPRQRWTHIEEYAAGATLQYPQWLGGFSRKDGTYINGQPGAPDQPAQLQDFTPPPSDLQSRHAWTPLPSWQDDKVANVQAWPYGAKGDGQTDDANAIQRAIDESDAVFLPKGQYRLSRPLVLRSTTRLFGVGNAFSALSPLPSGVFMNPQHPVPLIDTVDDPQADTVLAFVELRVPVTNPGVYALRWRAGRHSVVRNIRALPGFWDADAPPAFYPMIRIEGSGGGRWYDLYQDGWWAQGPDYRHLLINGTREPLSFYMLNPEHSVGEAQVEFRDAQNVNVYSLKAEGLFTVLWMRNCNAVRIYGYGGIAAARPNRPLFRIEDSDGILLANIDPDETLNQALSPELRMQLPWEAGWMPSDPQEWILISDAPGASGSHVSLHGIEQLILYKRGNPYASP